MSVTQVRPTFLVKTEKSAEELMQCIQRCVSDRADEFVGQFKRDHAMIAIEELKRHFWSPWMHLEIRNLQQVREVFCRFSPHPSIWTGFMFGWLAIAVLVLFALMFGVSQQMAGQTPWAYYSIPILLAIAGILWMASQAGQKLAQQEMQEMKAMIENCIPISDRHSAE